MEDVVVVGFIALVVVIVLILLAFAYMRGYDDGKYSNARNTDAQDAFRGGYNLGYMQGVETERKAQWKN